MIDYSKMSDFEINKRVAIALDIDMHFYIPESEDSFQPGFLPTELGPIWQTSAGFVGEFTVSNGNVFNPCNNPADAWPIISESRITVMIDNTTNDWSAALVQDFCDTSAFKYSKCHKNPLRAAMVTFLMMHEVTNVQTDSTW